MKWVMWAVALATGEPVQAYLVDCDVDACNGRGSIQFDTNIARAKRFENHTEMMRYWSRQSTTVPLRDDGGANRPMTAYTVEARAVDA